MLGCEPETPSQVCLSIQAKEKPHLFPRMEVPAASITQPPLHLDAVMYLSSISRNISRNALWTSRDAFYALFGTRR